jgi:hypothetical protein
MLDTSIITGKVYTGQPSASNAVRKRLYVKVFPGEFWHRPPRAKRAKVYGGELFIRYSGREWPEKKNGPLVGDQGLLESIGELLRTVHLVNVNDISYAKHQHNLKEVLTLSVGPDLAKEIIDRGWARPSQEPTPVVSKAVLNARLMNKAETSSIVNIGEAVMLPVESPSDEEQQETEVETVVEPVIKPVQEKPASKKKPTPPKKPSVQEIITETAAPKAEPKPKSTPQKKAPAKEKAAEPEVTETKKKQAPAKKK